MNNNPNGQNGFNSGSFGANPQGGTVGGGMPNPGMGSGASQEISGSSMGSNQGTMGNSMTGQGMAGNPMMGKNMTGNPMMGQGMNTGGVAGQIPTQQTTQPNGMPPYGPDLQAITNSMPDSSMKEEKTDGEDKPIKPEEEKNVNKLAIIIGSVSGAIILILIIIIIVLATKPCPEVNCQDNYECDCTEIYEDDYESVSQTGVDEETSITYGGYTFGPVTGYVFTTTDDGYVVVENGNYKFMIGLGSEDYDSSVKNQETYRNTLEEKDFMVLGQKNEAVSGVNMLAFELFDNKYGLYETLVITPSPDTTKSFAIVGMNNSGESDENVLNEIAKIMNASSYTGASEEELATVSDFIALLTKLGE